MSKNIKKFFVVTFSYWLFTLTDGALRIIVLFHFFNLGYSPFSLAFLFLLYELAGVFSNIIGGWITSIFGIKKMLLFGCSLQVFGILLLSFLDDNWNTSFSIIWILFSQGICGIAKDLTKTASKSAIKVTSNFEEQGELFKWVSWFTGSKNSMKGLGFFLGGILIQFLEFNFSLWVMVSFLILSLIIICLYIPNNLGFFVPSKKIKDLFSKSSNINFLSLSRVFMFGSRDIWFVVGLPVFLYSQNWNFWLVGSFLAFWTIGYGVVQVLAPLIIKKSPDGLSKEVPSTKLWGFLLALVMGTLFILLIYNFWNKNQVVLIIISLIFFGFVFAINSSLHSYLILAYSQNTKTLEDLGFYYSANACGRFLGTLLSGLLYQLGNIEFCVLGSFVFLIISYFLTLFLNKSNSHLCSQKN